MSEMKVIKDKSGNGNDVEQLVATDQPSTGSRTIGGLNALGFDGINHFLRKLEVISLTGGMTIVCLFYQDTNVVGDRSFGVRETTQSNLKKTFTFDTDNSLRYDGASSAGAVPPTIGEHFRIATKSADAQSQTDYIDGSLNINDTASLVDSTDVELNVGNVHLGAANRYFDGAIGECILIDSPVTNATRQKLEGYLAHKWGLTSNLPSNHPYKDQEPLIGV